MKRKRLRCCRLGVAVALMAVDCKSFTPLFSSMCSTLPYPLHAVWVLKNHEDDADSHIANADKDETSSLPTSVVSMRPVLSPSKSCRVNQMSGTDLAYIGDAVFELFVRSKCVWPSKRTSDLQNRVVSLVRGKSEQEDAVASCTSHMIRSQVRSI